MRFILIDVGLSVKVDSWRDPDHSYSSDLYSGRQQRLLSGGGY